ncbi:DNA repair protein rad18 [Astrocystis sublimbata]|nr:DNA repair protein rad18 [Astrocystis sublimbata]
MPNDGFDSVADSTDWLTTPLSGLAAVEAALRCQICKDFYRTPMLTSCNHTFCSLCIRRALSSDGKCPLCRAGEQEMKLRSNWSMEEVVAAFTNARAQVLGFARQPPPPPPQTQTKRRVDDPDDGLVACPICWRRMKAVQVDRHIDTSCPGEAQPDPPPVRRGPGRPRTKPSVFGPTTTTTTTINTATSTPFPSSTTTTPHPHPPPDRLPALNYSMLKDAQLRRELNEQGLSTSGNRALLERRHREWVMIWNANCDSQRPRRRAELFQDLDAWERTFGSRAQGVGGAGFSRGGGGGGGSGQQIRDKDFDGKAWAAQHDSSFQDLIANAKRSRAPDEDMDKDKTAQAQPRVGEVPNTSDSSGTDASGGKRVVVDLIDVADLPPAVKRFNVVEEKERGNEALPI